jgi:hypothetical protein
LEFFKNGLLFFLESFEVSDRYLDEGGGMVNGQSLDSMGRAIAKRRLSLTIFQLCGYQQSRTTMTGSLTRLEKFVAIPNSISGFVNWRCRAVAIVCKGVNMTWSDQ